MRFNATALAFLAIAAIVGEADAHAKLIGTTPTNGTAVARPTEVRLKFNEPIEIELSGIDLTTKAGGRVAIGAMAIDPADKAAVIVPISSAMKPGGYKVHWHMVSEDMHKVEGNFTFEVKE